MVISEYNNTEIRNSMAISGVIRTIIDTMPEYDRDKEHVYVVGLQNSNRIKYIDWVAMGITNASLMHPREIYRMAILQGITAIIVAHNHPSGNTAPSEEDKKVTIKLREAGDIIGIKLLDHIIVGNGDEYNSAADKFWL